jgi:hypothetical protein
LGFVAAVREAFDFVREFGLKELSAEKTIVRYASDRVFLNVFHGRSSYELGIEVGKLPAGDMDGYSIVSLIRTKDSERADSYRVWTAVTPEVVRDGLTLLAKDLKEYGERALKGDDEFYALLERRRRISAAEYAAEVKYSVRLPQANEAFRLHDYKKAAELYEGIRESLSPAELKKLEYAKRHA